MYVNLLTGESREGLPNPLWHAGTRYDNPSEVLCRVAGWRLLAGVDEIPAGKVAVSWSLVDLDGERAHKTAILEDAPPPPPMRLDKIKLRRALVAIDPALWANLKAYIAADEARQEEWGLAPYVLSDDPTFTACLPAVTAMLPAGTDVQALLASCQMEGPQ